jgi:hypothetical protein
VTSLFSPQHREDHEDDVQMLLPKLLSPDADSTFQYCATRRSQRKGCESCSKVLMAVGDWAIMVRPMWAVRQYSVEVERGPKRLSYTRGTGTDLTDLFLRGVATASFGQNTPVASCVGCSERRSASRALTPIIGSYSGAQRGTRVSCRSAFGISIRRHLERTWTMPLQGFILR